MSSWSPPAAAVEHVRRERVGDALEHEVPDERSQPGGAVGLAGVADSDAERKDQREVREEGVPCRAEDVSDRQEPVSPRPREAVLAEHVGLPEAEQERGGGQGGDRQHEGPADPLQLSEARDRALLLDHGACGGCHRGVLLTWWRQERGRHLPGSCAEISTPSTAARCLDQLQPTMI